LIDWLMLVRWATVRQKFPRASCSYSYYVSARACLERESVEQRAISPESHWQPACPVSAPRYRHCCLKPIS